jgi:hypothetical protein
LPKHSCQEYALGPSTAGSPPNVYLVSWRRCRAGQLIIVIHR